MRLTNKWFAEAQRHMGQSVATLSECRKEDGMLTKPDGKRWMRVTAGNPDGTKEKLWLPLADREVK